MEAYIWLGLMVLCLVVEGACPLHLVSVWFALGALVAAIAAMLTAPLWLQLVLFVVVSGALLALMWPLTKKVLMPKQAKTNMDAVIGSEGIVTEAIDNIDAVGQVKLGGMVWTARSTSGEPIPAGTRIRVDKIEGVRAFVTPQTVNV